MRNLKRALSLALAAIMLVGMMVVGASAVSYNDFSDREEIVNKDAVSMLVTLGVIDGKPDGSFAPTEGVDRAQMAKMISVIMNQGVDNGALYENSPSGLTDIADSWAKGHINYCYTTGIIAGRGNGTFDPNAGVTGSEAAKMLLVAAGYDPAIEGLTGADWEINTNALASKLGIFRNFKAPVSEPLTRDNAALLIYNALDVEMIESYTNNGYPIAFADSRTILSSMYGVYKVEGVVVGNEWAELEQTDSDAALKAGKTTLDNVKLYGSTTANTTKGENYEEIKGTVSFDVTTPVDMIGKTVTMYIEKTTILSNSKVLGVGTKDDVNVIHASAATSDTVKDYLKGTGLSVTKDTEFYVNYGYYATEAEAEAVINDYVKGSTSDKFNLNGIEVEVIDNNNDGDVDYVLYLQETLSKVSRYNAKSETISFWAVDYTNGKVNGEADPVTRDFADVVFADEVNTDDLILYVEYGGRTYVSLPEIVTGVMTRVDRNQDNELYITVEGETYKQSYILDAATAVDVDMDRFFIDNARTDVGFTTEYDFILDSNGYVVAVRPAEEKIVNYALVLDSAWTQNALDKSGQVKILMADNTVDTFTVNWNASDDAFKNVKVGNYGANQNSDTQLTSKLETYLGTRDVNEYGNTVSAARGSIITYTLSDDEVLTIKSVLQGNTFAGNTDMGIDENTNTSTTAGVGDNGDIVYMGRENSTLQYTASYTNGSGSITMNGVDETNDTAYGFKWNADTKQYERVDKVDRHAQEVTYAVDRNTVAFYYDGTNYGVATGWDNMSSVESVGAQVYPVLKKTDYRTYEASSLAGVILFEAEVKTTTSNYMLVLDANAATKDTWELTVVFEDGTVKAIEVDDDDLGNFKPEDKDDFMKAWTYSENADGTYKVGTQGDAAGTAVLLKNGTVDFTDTDDVPDNESGYIALSGKSNVWDVTDVELATDEAIMGTFATTKKNAVLVLDNNGAIRTAWVWDYDEGSTETPDVKTDFTFDTLSVKTPVAGKIEFSETYCANLAGKDGDGWDLKNPVITYTVTKNGGDAKTFVQKINKTVDVNNLYAEMVVPGYTINSSSTGDYSVKVLVKFNGTGADDAKTVYTISGTADFTIG